MKKSRERANRTLGRYNVSGGVSDDNAAVDGKDVAVKSLVKRVRVESSFRPSLMPSNSKRNSRFLKPRNAVFRKTILSSNQTGNKLNKRGGSKRNHRKYKEVRMPSKEGFHDKLKRNSAWFNTIMDPLGHADCKIPDETGLQTATMQIVERMTITANANKFCGARICTPYVNSVGGADGYNWQVVASTASPTSMTAGWVDSGGNVGQCTAFTSAAKFKEIARTHRIVSAEISVVPQMADLQNSGTMIAWVGPMESVNLATASEYLKRFGASAVAINSGKAAYSRWVPASVEQQTYNSFYPTDMTGIGQDDGDIPFWEMGVICEGLYAQDVAFLVTMVVNYEYVPRFNTIDLVEASPSPQDTVESDLVNTWVQQEPLTGDCSSSDVEKAPTATDLSQGYDTQPLGMGLMGKVMEFAKPILDTIDEIPVVGKLAHGLEDFIVKDL